MEINVQKVDWNSYARKYDMLLSYNPFYQRLHQEVFQEIQDWIIHPGDIIVDIGAGTGNYSTHLAALFPEAKVIHVDAHEGMNAEALQKKERKGLSNLEIRTASVADLSFEKEQIKACLCIHSLYTLPDPQGVLAQIQEWLTPGGNGLFVDAGRKVKVLEWQIAIGWHMVRTLGLQKTLSIMQEGREVSYQNKQIRKLQNEGVYWLHSHDEFVAAIQEAGFQVQKSKLAFRNISDFVVAVK